MHYIKEQSRDQVTLFPETLEDYISTNNPVQFIDHFVETLNLRYRPGRVDTRADSGCWGS